MFYYIDIQIVFVFITEICLIVMMSQWYVHYFIRREKIKVGQHKEGSNPHWNNSSTQFISCVMGSADAGSWAIRCIILCFLLRFMSPVLFQFLLRCLFILCMSALATPSSNLLLLLPWFWSWLFLWAYCVLLPAIWYDSWLHLPALTLFCPMILFLV